MINLLPDDTKKQLRAARTNVMLANFLIITSFAAGFLVLAFVATYLFLLNQKDVAIKQSKTTQQASVNIQANALPTAGSILSQQTLYSNIILGIANIIPSGVVLDKLPLSEDTLGTAMTLQFYASSTENANLLKQAVQASPLFSEVTVQPTIVGVSSAPSGYPIAISVNVTINNQKGLAL